VRRFSVTFQRDLPELRSQCYSSQFRAFSWRAGFSLTVWLPCRLACAPEVHDVGLSGALPLRCLNSSHGFFAWSRNARAIALREYKLNLWAPHRWLQVRSGTGISSLIQLYDCDLTITIYADCDVGRLSLSDAARRRLDAVVTVARSRYENAYVITTESSAVVVLPYIGIPWRGSHAILRTHLM
jgi:hypothetical protein